MQKFNDKKNLFEDMNVFFGGNNLFKIKIGLQNYKKKLNYTRACKKTRCILVFLIGIGT